MDPFAFATIVSLLATFHSGRESKKDIEEFKNWLNENNYGYMTAIIDNNKSLQQDLTSFMSQNHEQMMAQLSTLNDLMITVSSRIEGLGSIAASFDSNNGFSEQAIDVLRQFVKSDGIEMRHLQTWNYEGQSNAYYLDNGEVEYNEPRFIETDLDSLVNAGLITLTRGSKGSAIYKITRQAVRFIDFIDNN